MSQLDKAPVQPLDRKYVGSSNIRDYDLEQKLGEGTFGEVYKARSNKASGVFALKKILMHNEKDGFPITALREIKLLKMLSHENVIRLEEMAVEREKDKKKATLYMVFPYMEHDLSGLLDNREIRLNVPIIKCYMKQLLQGLRYLHASNILHRDMKAANLLISNRGILKIADFGLARHYDEQPPQAGRGNGEAQRDYTTLVVTRWYRPPELLLQLRRYTPAIDMWGAGCVFGEMFKRKPILSGKTDVNQAEIIFDLVGSPNDENMPGWKDLPGCEGVRLWDLKPGSLRSVFREIGPDAISLLSDLLTLDWRKRINAIDALSHPYFKNHPLPMEPHQVPHFMDSHELDRRTNGTRGAHQELPPAPPGGTVGGGPNGEWAPPNAENWGNGYRGSRYPAAAGLPPGRSRVPQASYDRGPPGPYDRHPQGPYDRQSQGPYDRPPQVQHDRPPQGSYNHRGPPPDRRRDDRYDDAPPGRSHHNLAPPPGGMQHALPPRPNGLPARPEPYGRGPPRDVREWDDRDRRGPLPPRKGNGASADVDTYIPNYNERGPPPPRRGSADDRHNGLGPRDDQHDRRQPPPPPQARLDYDDPRPSQRRTRSRSPGRGGLDPRERRERDSRDLYRR